MEKLTEIKTHWQSWANDFGDDLRATTRSSNIKKLEIKALIKMLKKHSNKPLSDLKILEVGCGNGFNSISIAKELGCSVDGFDFIPEMIESANANRDKIDPTLKNKVSFKVGDILDMDLSKKYDIIFSCRCLINLPTHKMQNKAIVELSKAIVRDGLLLLLENFNDNHRLQNNLREIVDLPVRKVAEFNRFFNFSEFSENLTLNKLRIKDQSNFSSLHDVMQYVIVPMLTGGETDYKHEVMSKVTQLLLSIESDQEEQFGEFGQNKLVVIEHA